MTVKTIASILRDGEDPNLPALRSWLQNLAGSVSASAEGLRVFATETALNVYEPATDEPRYAFVTDPKFAAFKYTGALPWVADNTYFEGVAAVVQPIIDDAVDKLEDGRTELAQFGQRVASFPARLPTMSVVDNQRNLVGAFDGDEVVHPQIRGHHGFIRRAGADRRLIAARSLVGSVLHAIIYGQSLGAGYTSGQHASADAPLLANAVRFKGGVRPRDGGATAAARYGTAFVPYAEQDGSQCGQTMGYAFIDMFCQLMLSEDGIDLAGQKILVSNAAEPSMAIADLVPGGGYFGRIIDDIGYGRSIAAAAGESYQLGVLLYQQGQSDIGAGTSPVDWMAKYRTIHTATAARAAEVGGLPFPLASLMFGLSTFPTNAPGSRNLINQAILNLCDTDEDKFFVAPEYIGPFVRRNDLHWIGAGQDIAGATAAVVAKRVVVDGIDPDRIRPLAPVVQGATVTIPFHVPTGTGLVVDESRWTPAALGASLRQADNATAIPMAARLIGGSRLQLRSLAGDLPAHFFVGWGDTDNDVGPASVTSLRDRQGDKIQYIHPSGVAIPIHNWVPNQTLEIGA